MTKKELEAKLEVLEDNGIVSQVFLHTIGLDDGGRITDNGKKVKCYRNYYYSVGVPKTIRNYIDKGYMKRASEDDPNDYWYFEVTEKGFDWLSELLGIKVEEDE